MRLTVLPLAAAGLLFAANASAQYETPAPTATPDAMPTLAVPEATPTPAAKPEVTTGAVKLKVGGVIWPTYRFDMTEGAEDKNEFDVSRAYINLYPTVSDTIDGRITFDIVSGGQGAGSDSTGEDVNTNTTGSLLVRLKYGYFAYHPVSFLELTAGMVPTPWIAHEEEVYGYRLLGETGAAQYYGIKSADFGYGAKAKAIGGRLVVHTQVQNGETYSKRETNKYKELASLASFQVLPAKEGGLKVAAFYSYALTDQDADKVRAIGMLSWQSKMFMGLAGYLMSQDGDGAGTHVNGGGPFAAGFVNLPFALPTTAGTRVLARVDVVDLDEDTEDDALTRMIAGVSIVFNEKAQMVFDIQQESFENTDLDPRQNAFVHWDLRF
jgi:hypothetical protein